MCDLSVEEAAKKAFYDEISRDNEKLKEFARYVIDSECWDNIDGGDIQGLAEKLGLIKECKLTIQDQIQHSEHYCEDDIGEATIYHFTDLIKE